MPNFYVDPIKSYAPESIKGAARHAGNRWCHLWTDGTADELHAFAARVGMRKEWFQPHRLVPHYDLVPSRRARALAIGAIEKGGGTAHRRSLNSEEKNRGGRDFYRWLEKHNFPPGYRVLCHNCNSALGMYGYCPHQNEARPLP